MGAQETFRPLTLGVLVMESSDESDGEDERGSTSDGSFDSQLDEHGLPPMPSPSVLLPEGLPPVQPRSAREAPPLPAEGPLPGSWGLAGDSARGSAHNAGEGRQRGLSSAEFFHERRE